MRSKNTLFTISIILLASLSSFAQTEVSYKEMMENNSYNFYEVVDAANAYFDANGRTKGSGWKNFERWKAENESKFYPSGDRSNVDFYGVTKTYTEIANQAQNLKNKASFTDGWVELGPWSANNITSHYSPGIGRVQDFWVNPNNTNQMYIASSTGGFWKSNNGGNTWQNTTDFLPAAGVFTFDVNPNNTNEILIAVCQGGFLYTHGIYRSTDAGATWTVSNFGPANLGWGGLGSNVRITKLRYHPTVANQVFVGTSLGLFVSTDNLDTWQSKFGGNVTDVAFHPNNTDVVYVYNNAGTDRNLLKISTNGGVSFGNAGGFPNNSNSRIYISTSPAEPNHVYAASTKNVYKSTDQGNSFVALSNPDETCLAFSVSDLNVNNMIYGYVDLQASTDGGNTFTRTTSWSNQNSAYIHADMQIANCINGVFYVATDGYFAKSTDNGFTWTKLNDGTGIRDFYAVGTSQGDYSVHMAGSQDNGTSILNKDGWIEWNGGDGMEALAHPLNQNWMIGSWQYGTRSYTRDGGQSRNGTENPEGGSSNAYWEAPFLINPLNQMQVLHFADSIYQGDKFGTEWSYKANPGINILYDASIAETDSNVIAVARGSSIRLTTNGGTTWQNISSGLPGYSITDIAFDPKNANTIVVTFNRYQDDGKKIYISFDQGSSWQNITYNLNNMPLLTVALDHSDSSYIYVGGEIGIYYKSINGTEWTLYNNNLPNACVKDLEIHYGSNRLRAATYGRGLWEYTLVGRNDYPAITHTSITSIPDDVTPKKGVDQYVHATIAYTGTLTEVKALWSLNDQSLTNEITMTNIGGNNWKSATPIGRKELGDMLYFKVIATSSLGQKSETYTFNYKVHEFIYCDAIGSEGTGSDYIKAVNLNGVTQTSGQDYYGDFTSTRFELSDNIAHELEVVMQYNWDSDSVTAWIDYNGDASFTNDEQLIFTELANFKATATIQAPQDVNLDTDLRMRIRSQYYSNYMDPCGDKYGEAEDYTVKFIHSTIDIKDVSTLEAFISPNPSTDRFNVSLAKKSAFLQVEVIDITGKTVLRERRENVSDLEIKHSLASGTYIAIIQTDNGQSQLKLVVK